VKGSAEGHSVRSAPRAAAVETPRFRRLRPSGPSSCSAAGCCAGRMGVSSARARPLPQAGLASIFAPPARCTRAPDRIRAGATRPGNRARPSTSDAQPLGGFHTSATTMSPTAAAARAVRAAHGAQRHAPNSDISACKRRNMGTIAIAFARPAIARGNRCRAKSLQRPCAESAAWRNPGIQRPKSPAMSAATATQSLDTYNQAIPLAEVGPRPVSSLPTSECGCVPSCRRCGQRAVCLAASSFLP